jgi:hypothetical protein
LAFAAVAVFVPAWAFAQPVPDRDTLLLVQFDGSTDADYAIGTAGIDARLSANSFTSGRFAGGVDLGADDRLVIVGGDGNFHPQQGTIELWFKPHWPGNDENKHGLMSCPIGDREYVNINYIGTGRLGIAIAAGQGDAWTWRRADAHIRDWEPETWHHVAFAWGDGRLCVYVDGKEGARQVTDAQMPARAPEAITISGADAGIDALRISRCMYSAEDARRSIRQALNPPYRHLSDLPWAASDGAWAGGRKLLGDVSIPLILGTQEYAKGIAARPEAIVVVRLREPYDVFQATFGVCSLSPPGASCSFEVFGDGEKLFNSDPVTCRAAPQPISLPIAGVKELKLAVRCEAPTAGSVYGIWAAPVVVRDPEVEVLLPRRDLKPVEIDMYGRQQGADDFAFEMEADSGCLVVPKFWEDEIDPTQRPQVDQATCALEAFATPGEYEPVNFVVYATEDLKQLAVRATELQCGDSMIPGGQIDVRLVLRRLMRDIYTYPPERSTIVSRFLLPNQPVDIPAGTFREYHLIVHVPEHAEPGQYSGTVRLIAADKDAIELPLTFEVLPFRLGPPGDKGYGVYYRFPGTDGDWSGIDVELADIRAHGGNMLKSNLGVDYETVDNAIRPSYERLRRGLTLLRKHGFHGPLPISTGCEHAARLLGYDPVKDHDSQSSREQFLKVIKAGMKGLAELSAEFPEFEFLATHMDEIFGRDRLERYIRFTEAVRQVPSLRVYITLHNDPRRDIAEMMRRCDPYVDVRCYNGHCMDSWIHSGHTFDDLARELEHAGDEAWIYHNIRGSFFMAEWTRLVNGYYLWISPLRIHVPWMYYSFKGNPFDATDGPRLRGGDFAYAVPDPDDPARMIPTRHWEAFREGVDDLRYLATLQSLAEKRPATAASDAALAWLERLRRSMTPNPAELEPIEKESPILVLLSRKLDGTDYRRIRREAAEHITALTK